MCGSLDAKELVDISSSNDPAQGFTASQDRAIARTKIDSRMAWSSPRLTLPQGQPGTISLLKSASCLCRSKAECPLTKVSRPWQSGSLCAEFWRPATAAFSASLRLQHGWCCWAKSAFSTSAPVHISPSTSVPIMQLPTSIGRSAIAIVAPEGTRGGGDSLWRTRLTLAANLWCRFCSGRDGTTSPIQSRSSAPSPTDVSSLSERVSSASPLSAWTISCAMRETSPLPS